MGALIGTLTTMTHGHLKTTVCANITGAQTLTLITLMNGPTLMMDHAL
jgi:hypothetical protein